MNLIAQPVGSKLCGHSAIAMVSGITLDESIRYFGHTHSSTIADYTRVLSKLGVAYGAITIVDGRKRLNLPKKAIVRLQYGKRRTGHLIAFYDGKFYDPNGKVYCSKKELLDCYNSRYRSRVRIDWFMEIIDKNSKCLSLAGK